MSGPAVKYGIIRPNLLNSPPALRSVCTLSECPIMLVSTLMVIRLIAPVACDRLIAEDPEQVCL